MMWKGHPEDLESPHNHPGSASTLGQAHNKLDPTCSSPQPYGVISVFQREKLRLRGLQQLPTGTLCGRGVIQCQDPALNPNAALSPPPVEKSPTKKNRHNCLDKRCLSSRKRKYQILKKILN